MFNQTERINNVMELIEVIKTVVKRDVRYHPKYNMVEFDLGVCTSIERPVLLVTLQSFSKPGNPKVNTAVLLDYSREDFVVGVMDANHFKEDVDVGRLSFPDVPYHIVEQLFNKIKEGNT